MGKEDSAKVDERDFSLSKNRRRKDEHKWFRHYRLTKGNRKEKGKNGYLVFGFFQRKSKDGSAKYKVCRKEKKESQSGLDLAQNEKWRELPKLAENLEPRSSLLPVASPPLYLSSTTLPPYQVDKGFMLWSQGKLSPMDIALFESIKCVGLRAYYLALPLEQLNLCVIIVESIEIQPNFSFKEEPIEFLAQEVDELQNKYVALGNVLW
ncbi:receptor-like protein kinase [Gossypium australe]|uniref:Receptor-like protein kinase n=1 Tax=Gossypium australe TaxID=47621 RepID=A0A5B6UZP8_9ROSI|nr:receptor-like protein kinase [Gossypium australe]